jgi:hypothetical protein
MATRADSDAETNVGGHQLGYRRRCGALVADTTIHTTLYATAAATAFSGAAVNVQWLTGEAVWKTRST